MNPILLAVEGLKQQCFKKQMTSELMRKRPYALTHTVVERPRAKHTPPSNFVFMVKMKAYCALISLCRYGCGSMCLCRWVSLSLCASVCVSVCLYLCFCVYFCLCPCVSLCVSVSVSILCVCVSVGSCLCESLSLSQTLFMC